MITISVPLVSQNIFVHNLCSILKVEGVSTKVERTKVKTKLFSLCWETSNFERL